MKYQSLTGKLLGVAALLCLAASANADQLQVTGANLDGNAVYNLVISPSGTTPVKPVIAGTVSQINSAADAATHGGFDALVWVTNSVCKSLDLIVTDTSRSQIVRYAGASTLPSCYNPAGGTPTVNPAAQIIFKWSKVGSGPAQPNGISTDAKGNLFIVSSSGPLDLKPSLWVLPFNASANLYCSGAAGTYCAPVLIDGKFGGTLTLALAETLVASAAAQTSTNTILWNTGDLLVLVGDSFDARLMVYSHSQMYSSNGQLNLHALPLNQPSSTPIPWAKFLGVLAAPFGMDIWPANAALGTNTSVLFTTIDGRILRYDTVQNKFVTDFADRLGLGLQKIKVGSYAELPYAFVAQIGARNTGQILVFGTPPSSGANTPLASISRSIMDPAGLAVTSSGSQSLPAARAGTTPCAPPNAPCVIAPLGPELVSTITAAPGDHLSGSVLEQNCIVQTDPRVTTTGGWTCNGSALPIGAGTNICPSFPAAVIPGSVCGHSGPTGAGFAVIEGTATGIDPNLNNSFVSTVGNIDAVMPGLTNLECDNFASTGQIPLMAWGTRSDLPTVEGTIPEDSLFGAPLGGQPGYLTELTGTCDTSTTGSRELSMFAIGLGLSNTSQAYVYTLQNQKFEALEQTVSAAAIATTAQSTLASDINTAENYVLAAQSGNFASNINCALNEIAATDTFLRGNLSAFSSNLITVAPGGGNENPAGDVDGRLANWYTVLNTMLAGNAPYASWPLPPSAVPACTPVSTGPQILSFTAPASSANDNVVANWTSVNTSSCTITTLYAFNGSGEGGYNVDSAFGEPTGGPGFGGYDIYYIIPDSDDEQTSAPPFGEPGWGSDTYTLTCYSPDGTNAATKSILNTSGFTNTTPTPLAITSFVTDPPDSEFSGFVGWTTANSTSNTVCTITDEFGGDPYDQVPTANLPANAALPEDSESSAPNEQYAYAFNSNAFCPASGPSQNTDTITLTCSDPSNGTAIKTLTLTNPGCEETE